MWTWRLSWMNSPHHPQTKQLGLLRAFSESHSGQTLRFATESFGGKACCGVWLSVQRFISFHPIMSGVGDAIYI